MGPRNETTVSLMSSFRKQYLKLVLLSGLKYATNEIFLYKMINSHLKIFINQFPFNSLLAQGHFVNALIGPVLRPGTLLSLLPVTLIFVRSG